MLYDENNKLNRHDVIRGTSAINFGPHSRRAPDQNIAALSGGI